MEEKALVFVLIHGSEATLFSREEDIMPFMEREYGGVFTQRQAEFVRRERSRAGYTETILGHYMMRRVDAEVART